MSLKTVHLWICIVFVTGRNQLYASVDLLDCGHALGMESELIPDSAIITSSSMDERYVGAKHSRIRHKDGGGAWCPREPITRHSYQYLQINFENPQIITKIETQGRFPNGQGIEFVDKYYLEYKKSNRTKWIRFTDERGKQLFQGNVNQNESVAREVWPPITCTNLRVVPYTLTKAHVCLRLEVYGCAITSDCNQALGMESGDIADSCLVASSTYSKKLVDAQHSRIRHEDGGGAWCPKHVISRYSYEYLQINFDKPTIITSVETQGRFGKGMGKELANQYFLEYQWFNESKWSRFQDGYGQQLFDGNVNVYEAVIRDVWPLIACTSIRFVPYSIPERTVCLRVEVYGCRINLKMDTMHNRDKKSKITNGRVPTVTDNPDNDNDKSMASDVLTKYQDWFMLIQIFLFIVL